jgi:prepilin signal peptidase PulO-like enzyme (type II secretory pathway)
METLTFIFVFIFGLILGSFLNCLVWRLHQNETLGGRSYCPRCRAKISWYDNIPLLSFLLLRGRCRHCQKRISFQYPLVEVVTAILLTFAFLAVFSNFLTDGSGNFNFLALSVARDWILICTLVIVFIYDFRWQEVPMLVVWPISAVILAFNLLLGYSFWSLLLAAATSGAFFLLQYLATKKRGLGEGDIWLGVLLGCSFPNLPYLVLAILMAYFIGSLVALPLLLSRKKKLKSKIALGPFLAIGAVISLIWGQSIITWYLNFFYF